jgi:hypothetical protein
MIGADTPQRRRSEEYERIARPERPEHSRAESKGARGTPKATYTDRFSCCPVRTGMDDAWTRRSPACIVVHRVYFAGMQLQNYAAGQWGRCAEDASHKAQGSMIKVTGF